MRKIGRFSFFFILVILPLFTIVGQSPADTFCDQKASILYDLDIANEPQNAIVVIEEMAPELLANNCLEYYADCFNNLSVAYYYLRNYKLARENAQKASEVSEKYLGKELMYAAAIANLAVFESPEKSIELQKESLQIERALGEEYEFLVYALEGLGLSYQDIGDWDTSIDYFQQAIQIIKKNESKTGHEEARLLRQIASCHKAQNRTKETLKNLKQCLSILESLPNSQFFSQTQWYAFCELADGYFQERKIKQAKYYIEKAIEIQGQYDLLEAYKSWMIYGDICLAEKERTKALSCFNKSLASAEKEFSEYEYHLGLAQPMAALGNFYAQERNFEEALKYFGLSLERLAIDFEPADFLVNPDLETLVNKLEVLNVLKDKAAVLVEYYNDTKSSHLLKAAHQTNMVAAQLIYFIRRDYLSQGAKHDLIEQNDPLYVKAINLAWELYKQTDEHQYLSDAFRLAESNKAVLLYESIKNNVAKEKAGVELNLLQEGKALQQELAFYETMLLEEKQKKEKQEDKENLKDRIFELKENIQNHKDQLEQNFPYYKVLKEQVEPVALNDFQEKLAEHTVVMEFALGEEQGFVFCIAKDNFFVYPIPGKENLRENVERLLQLLSKPSGRSEEFKRDFFQFCETSSLLYQQLFAPVLELTSTLPKHFIIVPDDLLNALPFELLLTNNEIDSSSFYKELPYLFNSFPISYHYSVSLISNASSTTNSLIKQSGKFIGFAPSFGETITNSRFCSGNELSGLICNKKEVLAINEIWEGQIFTGSSATLESFKSEAINYDMIHLATHACIAEEEEGLNKIYFSNGESLAQQALNGIALNASLTVLSACNTGRGKIRKGEGVMSLARSFLLTGSQSVLTSLWSVDDCSTADIMYSFYAILKSGKTKEEALEEAKHQYLEKADQSNSHPYYWAGFILLGNGMPVTTMRRSYSMYWIGMLVMILLMGYFKVQRLKN